MNFYTDEAQNQKIAICIEHVLCRIKPETKNKISFNPKANTRRTLGIAVMPTNAKLLLKKSVANYKAW